MARQDYRFVSVNATRRFKKHLQNVHTFNQLDREGRKRYIREMLEEDFKSIMTNNSPPQAIFLAYIYLSVDPAGGTRLPPYLHK